VIDRISKFDQSKPEIRGAAASRIRQNGGINRERIQRCYHRMA
jgi:hypothetical protein